MSQYRIVKHHDPVPNEPAEYTVYIYGYDRQLYYYFLFITDSNVPTYKAELENPDGSGTVELVGMLSPRYGDKMNLHDEMNKQGIWHMIPEEHKSLILMDLPI